MNKKYLLLSMLVFGTLVNTSVFAQQQDPAYETNEPSESNKRRGVSLGGEATAVVQQASNSEEQTPLKVGGALDFSAYWDDRGGDNLHFFDSKVNGGMVIDTNTGQPTPILTASPYLEKALKQTF